MRFTSLSVGLLFVVRVVLVCWWRARVKREKKEAILAQHYVLEVNLFFAHMHSTKHRSTEITAVERFDK
jgi:hypothetical protein